MPMSVDEVRSGLQQLDPAVPWTHHIELGHGIETITAARDEKYYKKAVGLKSLGRLVERLVVHHTRRGRLDGLRILDVACGEGGHSLALAQLGADVVGVEGRPLYVRRAEFAARALGCERARFITGDVRALDRLDLGRFDLVLCSGILHHLGPDHFESFLRSTAAVCADTTLFYTHIATDVSVREHRLKGPVEAKGGHQGWLFREHEERTTKEERMAQVRASLDETMSFWATDETLLKALVASGYAAVFKVLHPHVFTSYERMSYRPIVIARK